MTKYICEISVSICFITKRWSTVSAIGNIWAATTEYQQQYPDLELHVEIRLRMTHTCEWDWFLPHECMQKVKSEVWLCFGCSAANPTYIGYKCRQDVHEGTSMEDFARWWLFYAYHYANTLKPLCWRITRQPCKILWLAATTLVNSAWYSLHRLPSVCSWWYCINYRRNSYSLALKYYEVFFSSGFRRKIWFGMLGSWSHILYFMKVCLTAADSRKFIRTEVRI